MTIITDTTPSAVARCNPVLNKTELMMVMAADVYIASEVMKLYNIGIEKQLTCGSILL